MAKSVDAKDLLKALQTETISDLYLKDRPSERAQKHNKTSMVSEMAKDVELAGIKCMFANLHRDVLAEMLRQGKVDLKEGEKETSKVVVARRLELAIAETSLHSFLTDHANEELLHAIAQQLSIDAEDEKKDGLIKEIVAVVQQLALESYFSGFDVDLLQDVADDLKLKTQNSHNKRKLVECIVTKKDVAKEPKAKKQKVDDGGKKKKTIAKGITYEEIFQHYNVTEVRDYCKEHDIPTSGKKAVLIKRVLAFHRGEDVSSKKKVGKKGKKGGKSEGEEEETKEETKEEEETNGKDDKKAAKK